MAVAPFVERAIEELYFGEPVSDGRAVDAVTTEDTGLFNRRRGVSHEGAYAIEFAGEENGWRGEELFGRAERPGLVGCFADVAT